MAENSTEIDDFVRWLERYGNPVAIVFVILWFAAFFAIEQIFPGLLGYISDVSRLGGMLLILVVGVALYIFRTFARMYYGTLEVASALFIGYLALGKYELSGFGEIAAILTAIYFVVRGLDNIFTGAADLDSKDPPELLSESAEPDNSPK